MHRQAALALAVLFVMPVLSAGEASAFQSERRAFRPEVKRVPAIPPSLRAEEPEPRSTRSRQARRACLPVDSIVGAIVMSERMVELTLRGGARWQMRFADECPALSYYQGFYYRRTTAGNLCAGRDAVIARSGGECPIDSLSPIKSKAKKRR